MCVLYFVAICFLPVSYENDPGNLMKIITRFGSQLPNFRIDYRLHVSAFLSYFPANMYYLYFVFVKLTISLRLNFNQKLLKIYCSFY